MIQTQTVTYHDGDVTLEGYYACKQDSNRNRPLIVVAHDWSGRNAFACQKAEQLAELGYVGFALDNYGNAQIGKTTEEKSALIQPFMQDRSKLLQRLFAGIEAAKLTTHVDKNNIGAIGFCFGGLCVLDLARHNVDMKGVVSFHGLLMPPAGTHQKPITARVLAQHGFDDPMVTPTQAMEFGTEMTKAKADWEMVVYGNAMHAFTNPEAHDASFGTVYNPLVAERSWKTMQQFFSEVFGK